MNDINDNQKWPLLKKPCRTTNLPEGTSNRQARRRSRSAWSGNCRSLWSWLPGNTFRECIVLEQDSICHRIAPGHRSEVRSRTKFHIRPSHHPLIYFFFHVQFIINTIFVRRLYLWNFKDGVDIIRIGIWGEIPGGRLDATWSGDVQLKFRSDRLLHIYRPQRFIAAHAQRLKLTINCLLTIRIAQQAPFSLKQIVKNDNSCTNNSQKTTSASITLALQTSTTK